MADGAAAEVNKVVMGKGRKRYGKDSKIQKRNDNRSGTCTSVISFSSTITWHFIPSLPKINLRRYIILYFAKKGKLLYKILVIITIRSL